MKRIFDLWPAAATLAVLIGAPACAAEAPPVAAAAHLIDDGARARLSFDLSAPVAARAREIVDPDRIVIDMPEVDFRLDPQIGRVVAPHADALVKAFRFGLFGPGKSRVVIDLARPACVAKVGARRLVRNGEALAADARTESLRRERLRRRRARSRPAPPPSRPPRRRRRPQSSGLPVIVLDPGHGGIDGGAYGLDGAVEKTLVYAFADALRAKLEATGRYRVVMTRDRRSICLAGGSRRQGARRQRRAVRLHPRRHAAGIDRGLRHDGLHLLRPRLRRRGAARRRERERRRPAGRRGAQGRRPRRRRHPVRPEAARDARLRASVLARPRGAARRGGALNHHPERSAGFVVLKAPDFPSVLVELGYLSNAHDVANLKSPEWREKTARGDAGGDRRLLRQVRAAPRRGDGERAGGQVVSLVSPQLGSTRPCSRCDDAPAVI